MLHKLNRLYIVCLVLIFSICLLFSQSLRHHFHLSVGVTLADKQQVFFSSSRLYYIGVIPIMSVTYLSHGNPHISRGGKQRRGRVPVSFPLILRHSVTSSGERGGNTTSVAVWMVTGIGARDSRHEGCRQVLMLGAARGPKITLRLQAIKSSMTHRSWFSAGLWESRAVAWPYYRSANTCAAA